MESNSSDFGTVLFKFFSSWLNEDSTHMLVKSSWACDPVCNRPDVNMCRKLKALKAILKSCSKNLRHKSVQESAILTKHLEELDLKAEIGVLFESDCNLRFTDNNPRRPRFHSNKFKTISELQKCFLERPFEYDEIKNAVWSYGEVKASGLNGYTFRGSLSPFFFIIAMEALHIALMEAREKGVVKGVEVGKNQAEISHLQYADDALLAPISVINRLEHIRRKFFWHVGVEEKKVSWVAWSKVVAPVKLGGLGIGSLKAFNLSLLFKWLWRWHTDEDALWYHTLHSIHGPNGGDFLKYTSIFTKGSWYDILKACHDVNSLNIPFSSFFTRSIGEGVLVKFWDEEWLEKEEMESLACLLEGVELKSGPDQMVGVGLLRDPENSQSNLSELNWMRKFSLFLIKKQDGIL
ncbi:hypothetical protein Tco_0560595 [Tanacetum coccineum]